MNTTKKAPVQKNKQRRKRAKAKIPITQGPVNKPMKQTFTAIPRIVPESTGSAVISNMKVDVVLDPTAMQLPFIAFYAHLCQSGLMNQLANTNLDIQPYSTVASAMRYFFDSTNNIIASGTIAPANVPLVFRDLIAALLPKTITTRSGNTISYGWTYENQAALTPYTVGGFPWLFMEPLIDTNTYLTGAAVVNPTPDQLAYGKIIALIDKTRNKNLRIVGNVPSDSPLFTSVSAFARNYVYNGLQCTGGNVAGFYKDIELEVPIFHPCMSQFTGYGTDTRAPRYLSLGSGDACVSYALPQHPGWGGYGNQGHIIYKFIDFENIYDTLCLWACKCKESLISCNDAGFDSSVYTSSFTFSQQDFRITLRQALIGFFAENYWTQFQGPLAADTDQNWFQPFYVNGATYGAAQFQMFQLPLLIRENLAALKHRVIKASKKYKIHIVPVLGRYRADTPSVYTYSAVTLVDSVPTALTQSLFTISAQSPINLIDASRPDGYVNLNGSYYQNVMNDWNSFCGGVNKVSTVITAIGSDAGPPGLVVLSMTRQVQDSSNNTKHIEVVQNLELDTRYSKRQSVSKKVELAPAATLRPLQIMKRVSNYQKASALELGAIPPSTSSRLSSVSLTSIKAVTSEELSLLQNLIVPTVRFDPYSTQVLTMSKYQTEVGEFSSAQFLNTTQLVAAPAGLASVLQTWSTLAGMCVKGQGGECSEYASIMQMLCETGHAGFLAGILGGFAKSFLPPELHGVVDTVASVVPY